MSCMITSTQKAIISSNLEEELLKISINVMMTAVSKTILDKSTRQEPETAKR